MKKTILTNLFTGFLVLLFCVRSGYGQTVPYYTFTKSNDIYSTFSTGTTVLGSGTSLNNQRYSVNLPFTFTLDGVDYTQAYISANGYITLGATDPGATNYTPLSTSPTGIGVVSAFGRDLNGLNASSELSYITTGTYPNRIFITQWKGFTYGTNFGYVFNFQIRLKEAGNVIEIWYGSNASSLNTTTGQTGIRGATATNFNARTNSTSWANSAAATSNTAQMTFSPSVLPADGLIYAWAPPATCVLPAVQPTALILSPDYTTVAGSFTPSAGADAYLVLMTPGQGTQPTVQPVNHTYYTAGATIGNSTVVSAGAAASFNHTGLISNNFYTYSIYAYNWQCTGGPAYDTLLPLTASVQTFGPKSYVWQPNTVTGNYNTPANWVPARVNADPGDTLIFNNGGADTITSLPAQINVNNIVISNNTKVVFDSSKNITIRNLFRIDANTAATFNNNTAYTLNFLSSGAAKQATIDGVLNLGGNYTYNAANALTTVNGTVNVYGAGAAFKSTCTTCIQPDIIFGAGAVYNHQRNGGTLPRAVYHAASTINITGIIDTVPAITYGQDVGNLNWNCPGQTASVSLASNISAVLGDFNVITTNNNTLQLGSTPDVFNVAGNFTLQSGTVKLSSTSGMMRVFGDFNLNGGIFDISSFANAGYAYNALFLFRNVTQQAANSIIRSGTAIPAISFCGNVHQLITIGGYIGNTPLSYRLNNRAGATLTGTLPVNTDCWNYVNLGKWDGAGTFTYTGTNNNLAYSSQAKLTPTAIEWPAVNTPYNVTVSLTGDFPDNQLMMPGSRNVAGIVDMPAGYIVLNNYDLSVVQFYYTNPLDASSMVIADSTGQLKMRRVAMTGPSGSTSFFPVGDRNLNYTPVYLTMYSNAATRYFGINLRNRQHPNDASPTNYLKRYWNFTDDGGTAPYTYQANFDFMPYTDIEGVQNFRLNSWDGSVWKAVPSTTYNYQANFFLGVLDVANNVSSADFPLGGRSFTGRPTVNHTYSWTGATSMDYQEPSNWTPARTNPDPNDLLQFNSGHIDTVKYVVPTEEITRLTCTNNTTVIMQSDTSFLDNVYLTIHSDFDTLTDEFRIDSGSALYLTGGLSALRITFRDPGNPAYQARGTIAGRLEIYSVDPQYHGWYSYYNGVNFFYGKVTVTESGVLACGGTAYDAVGAQGGLIINGLYEHKYETIPGNGGIPGATWGPNSLALIKGYTTATTFPTSSSPVVNLTYNCPNQTTVITTSNMPHVTGLLKVVATGTGTWKWGPYDAPKNVGNYLQTGGSLDMNGQILNVSGTFNQAAGTFFCSGPMAKLNFTGTSGMQEVNFKDNAPAGAMIYQLSNPDGIHLTGTGSLTTNFNINSGGGITVATPHTNLISSALQLAYNPVNTTLAFDTLAGYAPGAYTVENMLFPAVNGPANLTLNIGTANTLTMPFTRTITGILKMVKGNIDIGGNELTIGSSAAAPGTLTWTSGSIKLNPLGKLTRWYGTTGLPVTAGTAIGYYPITPDSINRNVAVYFSAATAISNGGTISVSHGNIAGYTTAAITDGSATINKRTNTTWNLAPGNGLAMTGTLGFKLTTGNLFAYPVIPFPADIRVAHATNADGVHVAASGAMPGMVAERKGLAVADLASGPYYIGLADAPVAGTYISVNSGSWNDPATWDVNAVPVAGAKVFISNGDTVSVKNIAVAKTLTVNQYAVLRADTSVLTIDSLVSVEGTFSMNGGTVNAGNAMNVINNGVLTVDSGTLTITKSLLFPSGANTTFNQSGGNIRLLAGTTIYAATVHATGGNLVLVNPGTFTGSLKVTAATNHTTYFGDGTSSATGTFTVTNGALMGNVVMKGTNNATRTIQVTTGSITIMGNLTMLSNGGFLEYKGAGNQILGNVSVDNGSSLTSALFAFNGTDSIQTVSGAGTFKTSVTTAPNSAAKFSSLTVNNPYGVQFAIGDVPFSATLTFSKGNLYMGNNTLILTDTVSPYHVNASQSTGWIVGKYQQSLKAVTATTVTYPVGDTTSYTPLSIISEYNGIRKRGKVTVSVTKGDHPAIASSSVLPDKSVNRYYTIDTSGGIDFTTFGMSVIPYWKEADEDMATTWEHFFAASYKDSTWTTRNTYNLSDTTLAANYIGDNLAGDYQVGETSPLPVIWQQPADQSVCGGLNATFSVNAQFAISYRWQVKTGGTWTYLTNNSTYTGTASSALYVINPAPALNGTQYRCIVFGTEDSVISNAATLSVNASVSAAVAIAANPGAVICTGTPVTFTATATNGGPSPVYQWKKNGIVTGSSNATYTDNNLQNNDTIVCVLTSSLSCASPAAATSASILMSVNPAVNPSVSITAGNSGAVCAGTTITYTAAPVNGGSAPSYQWKKDNVNVGANSSTYADNAPANGSVITCTLTNTNPCAGPAAVSNSLTQSVNPMLTPALTVTPGANTICSGASVTFTATAANAGTNPSYQWKKNNSNVGTNSSTYTDATLQNGDVISCVLTVGTGPCFTTTTVTTTASSVTVNANTQPTVNITATAGNTICAGQSNTFNAVVANGGATPQYQWTKNGGNVGANNPAYTDAALNTNDVITCQVTYTGCYMPATGNSITMTVNPVLTPAVSIAASQTTICSGVSVTFTATITNGGSAPVYQWKKNNANVGTNSAAYTDAGLADGDIISCTLTANVPCANPANVASNNITMTVSPVVTPTISIAAPVVEFCQGSSAVTINATITNGGNTPAYQWKKNGLNVGGNTPSYTDAALANGDQIVCELTSSATCASATTTASNTVTFVVHPVSVTNIADTICQGDTYVFGPQTLNTSGDYTYVGQTALGCDSTIHLALTVTPSAVPAVTITANPGVNVSNGQSVIFTAAVTNAGTSPVMTWYKNDVVIPAANALTWTGVAGTDFHDGDQINARLKSNAPCASPDNALSAKLTMHIQTTGIGNAGKPVDFFIYPNPTTETVWIDGMKQGGSVVIYDVLGRKMATLVLPAADKHDLKMGPYAAGVYTLHLTDNKGNAWQAKVIKD